VHYVWQPVLSRCCAHNSACFAVKAQGLGVSSTPYLLLLRLAMPCSQWDDPLDAIAVHAWNGTWGVLSCGFFSAPDLITNAYGLDQNGNQRPYGCFFTGSDGHLLAAQISYALWIAGAPTGLLLHALCLLLPRETPIGTCHLQICLSLLRPEHT
jgi:ammonia channel protein AmtB